MIDILTVYGQYNPFKELQKELLKKYTKDYTHYTIQGGTNGSYSHGEALDKLMRIGSGEIVCSLDSDAFPVNHWLDLLYKLDRYDAIAIPHRFGFGHPSFFVAKRETLKGKSWQREGNKDVGRKLSEGLNIYYLEQTGFFAKNPDPKEPDIGSVYSNRIFHNWYTSRTIKHPNPDGVPNETIIKSINHALKRYSYEM